MTHCTPLLTLISSVRSPVLDSGEIISHCPHFNGIVMASSFPPTGKLYCLYLEFKFRLTGSSRSVGGMIRFTLRIWRGKKLPPIQDILGHCKKCFLEPIKGFEIAMVARCIQYIEMKGLCSQFFLPTNFLLNSLIRKLLYPSVFQRHISVVVEGWPSTWTSFPWSSAWSGPTYLWRVRIMFSYAVKLCLLKQLPVTVLEEAWQCHPTVKGSLCSNIGLDGPWSVPAMLFYSVKLCLLKHLPLTVLEESWQCYPTA